MELNRSALIVGTMVAIALGAAAAWWSRPTADSAQGTPAASSAAHSLAEPVTPPRLYKWQDDNGVWNFTDQPPTDRSYKEVRGTPNVTSVPTIVPEVPMSDQAETIPPPSD